MNEILEEIENHRTEFECSDIDTDFSNVPRTSTDPNVTNFQEPGVRHWWWFIGS